MQNAKAVDIILQANIQSITMNNWFYMDRPTFECLLREELGTYFANVLIEYHFDTPISFMIGETPNEILAKIQLVFSRNCCHKRMCSDQCLVCSFSPPLYAKLAWFVQRLLIMSPFTKPFIKPTSLTTLINNDSTSIAKKNSTSNIYPYGATSTIMILFAIMFLFFVWSL
jgi:hypothetical protein